MSDAGPAPTASEAAERALGLVPDSLALLVCPACQGPLAAAGLALECAGCRLRYPVEEGVPVLLASRAVPA